MRDARAPARWRSRPRRSTAGRTGGLPMSETITRRRSLGPAAAGGPASGGKNVTDRRALTATPRTAPVRPSIPLGRSIDTTIAPAAPAALIASTIAAADPSSGRARPAPNRASTITSALCRRVGSAGSTTPRNRAAAAFASPVRMAGSPRRPSRTMNPRSDSTRAATKPSPPLLPGPQTTATRVPCPCRTQMSAARHSRHCPSASRRGHPSRW